MVGASENGIVKEGGCTIRIGATGKVSALMMQQLDFDAKTSSKKPGTQSRRIQTAPVSIPCGVPTKRPQRMVSLNGGSSRDPCNQIKPGRKKKMKNTSQALQEIPMLDSEDLWIDKTPNRGKVHEKKVTQRIVEVVDLKCGNHEGDWSIPIGNQLRRLSFSKISD